MDAVAKADALRSAEKVSDKYASLVGELNSVPAGNYSVFQAERLADRVLEDGGYADGRDLVPIVELAKKFGFSCFRELNMSKEISGNIFVGGTTKQVYHSDKVIVVGADEERPHQRFIIAHELGHYLMDYLGSDRSRNPNLLFSETYPKQNHDSPKEIRADRFAAELLMPMRVFMKRYVQVMELADNSEEYCVSYLARLFGVKKSCVRKRIHEVLS